jgi:hypothetical protein
MKTHVKVPGVLDEIRIVHLSNMNLVFYLYVNRQKPVLNCTGMSAAYIIVKNLALSSF